jgi:hypothetical protein
MIGSVAEFARFDGVRRRSQLDCYLSEAGVEPPQTYGWRMEDVVARVARGGEPPQRGSR